MAKPATQTRPIDETKMNEMLGRVVSDFGATASSALVVIGDRLGFYKTLASDGPLTSTELAQRTQTTERYVREWLINQAAGGEGVFPHAGASGCVGRRCQSAFCRRWIRAFRLAGQG